ncbi:hypothetical protein J2TS6_48340 [Paenibacillus albilobatus]|uniref:Uncharacterized protein n=1 Tax=Paenibacillus albilobatus TaxID=2716884 RepID=A0A919XP42_9BACL|nr:hypothetical protein [Paenibacillus albilobatus]GIO33693.1 hypothetical protein J2TS6_48340 [Paenibacillus albilobatus]
MSGKVIQNDEQYEKARVAVLDMAAKLDDPLNDMSAEERRRMMAVYDRTTDLMQRYRRGQLVQRDPFLREIYKQIGYEWQEFGPLKQEDKSGATAPPPGPDKPKERPAKRITSDWLD